MIEKLKGALYYLIGFSIFTLFLYYFIYSGIVIGGNWYQPGLKGQINSIIYENIKHELNNSSLLGNQILVFDNLYGPYKGEVPINVDNDKGYIRNIDFDDCKDYEREIYTVIGVRIINDNRKLIPQEWYIFIKDGKACAALKQGTFVTDKYNKDIYNGSYDNWTLSNFNHSYIWLYKLIPDCHCN